MTINEKELFIKENQNEWIEIGNELCDQRIELGITLAEMSRLLGTSTTRIRNFEKGMPVMMANGLKASYKLALELTKKRQEEMAWDELDLDEELDEIIDEDYSLWDKQI